LSVKSQKRLEVEPQNRSLIKFKKKTQAPNDYEISINYVQNGIIWNRNKICVDNFFAYSIAIEVINEENYVPKTPEECMHINDWPK
jgi:hypothetical protein